MKTINSLKTKYIEISNAILEVKTQIEKELMKIPFIAEHFEYANIEVESNCVIFTSRSYNITKWREFNLDNKDTIIFEYSDSDSDSCIKDVVCSNEIYKILTEIKNVLDQK